MCAQLCTYLYLILKAVAHIMFVVLKEKGISLFLCFYSCPTNFRLSNFVVLESFGWEPLADSRYKGLIGVKPRYPRYFRKGGVL